MLKQTYLPPFQANAFLVRQLLDHDSITLVVKMKHRPYLHTSSITKPFRTIPAARGGLKPSRLARGSLC